jgi:plastocyanin
MNSLDKRRLLALALAAGLVFALSSCSHLHAPVKPMASEGKTKVVEMAASSFEFDPNNIEASQGDLLVIMVMNHSSISHNLTVKDPQGRVIQSVGLPEKQTVRIELALTLAGTYEFYCDKPLHPALGMKGQILVRANSM